MRLLSSSTIVILAVVILVSAQGVGANAGDEQRRGTTKLTPPHPHEGVADLPYSRGKRFRTLDEYLAHLERQGAIDLPWWREVRPGVYEQVVRMPGARTEIATRAELMRRFGFQR